MVNHELDHTLMALADPTRRAIIQSLAKGEARITEIAKPFPISLNAVSKHIRILERANLVTRRREGREHLIGCNPKPLDEAAIWIDEMRNLWNYRLQVLDDLLIQEDKL